MQFGGVASDHLDRDLAPYVRRSFLKHFKIGVKYVDQDKYNTWEKFENRYKDELNTASIDAYWNIFENYSKSAYKYARDMLEKEGNQATQALYHNLNTLESRAGSQVPFTSINFGLDTSFEGRKVTEWCLNASIDGIGQHHETPIFPISIFIYKRHVNDVEGTPNYDLKRLAIKSLCKRIYPNFANGDWISNEADKLPCEYVMKGTTHSRNAMLDVEIFFNNVNIIDEPELITYLADNKFTYYIKRKVSLDKLVTLINKNNFKVLENDEKLYDLRFNKDILILVKDVNVKNNQYNISENDHYTKLNWINYNKDDKTFSLTTESFGYNIYEYEKNIDSLDTESIISEKHIQYKCPEYDYDTEIATMGCCDGVEVITYKLNNVQYQESFEKAFIRVSEFYNNNLTVFGNSTYIDTPDMFVYDSYSDAYVKTTRFIQNNDMGNWNRISFLNTAITVLLTGDHPLPTDRGRVYVKDLAVNDKVYKIGYKHVASNVSKTFTISKIEALGKRGRYGYDLETASDHFDISYINSHNCRTLLGKDVNGMGFKKTGRGNISPVTINLTKIGIKHGICLGDRTAPDVDGFFEELQEILKLSEKALLDRFNYICSQNVRAGTFMYYNGTIADADKSIENGVYESMKHGTNAIGYVGVANACYAMFGKYHDQDKDVLEFAIKIVKAISDYAKDATIRNHLNFSAYASPCENSCKTICSALQKEYGKIKGVCDKSYLTNSHHVPVFEKISINDKIDIESKFAYMATGGCITYVELESSIMNNPSAVERIIDMMMVNRLLPYAAINFPIDTCQDCGHSGEINKSCPICGSNDIKRLRRITGYLSSDYHKFNKGKFDECIDRVKHSKYTKFN